MVEPESPQTILRMRLAYWISKATRVKAHARSSEPTPTRMRSNRVGFLCVLAEAEETVEHLSFNIK